MAINIYIEVVGHTSFLLHTNVKETVRFRHRFVCVYVFFIAFKTTRFTFDLEIEFYNSVLRNRSDVASNGDVAQRLLLNFYSLLVFVTYIKIITNQNRLLL